jgi:hypothetical protein
MFVAWFITISVFLICIYATIAIIDSVKEKDQFDLEILQSQYKNIAISKKVIKKQIA